MGQGERRNRAGGRLSVVLSCGRVEEEDGGAESHGGLLSPTPLTTPSPSSGHHGGVHPGPRGHRAPSAAPPRAARRLRRLRHRQAPSPAEDGISMSPGHEETATAARIGIGPRRRRAPLRCPSSCCSSSSSTATSRSSSAAPSPADDGGSMSPHHEETMGECRLAGPKRPHWWMMVAGRAFNVRVDESAQSFRRRENAAGHDPNSQAPTPTSTKEGAAHG